MGVTLPDEFAPAQIKKVMAEIKHIVVLMLENRSFDHLLGWLQRCVIGLAGAATASGLLRSFLFGVSPFDLPVLILAAIAVFLLALTASAIPAHRAASIDPMQALRGE
jgi:ABC-type lipoprotein release transport system permease subunit